MELPVLPECRQRGAKIKPGWFQCLSKKVSALRGVTVELCRQCPVRDHEGELRAVPAPEKKAEPAKCPHLGEPTGETVDCPSCGRNPDGKAKVKVKLMACAVHGQCTVGKKAEGVQCCRGCPDNPNQ